MGDKPLLEVSVTTILGVLLAYALPFFGLFTFGAVEESLTKAITYYSTGAGFLLGLISLALIQSLVDAGKLPFDKWGWARVWLYSPKESLLSNTFLSKYLTLRNLFHFSIVFGLILSFVGVVTQTSFVGLPPVEAQVTETGRAILSSEPASFTETIMMTFFISLLAGLSYWFTKKNKLGDLTYKVLLGLSTFVVAGIWVAIHYVRYGNQETALLSVLFFGFFGTLLTLITGSPLSWYVWHFFNNLFIKFSELFSSELVTGAIVGFIILYVVMLVVVKAIKSSGGNK